MTEKPYRLGVLHFLAEKDRSKVMGVLPTLNVIPVAPVDIGILCKGSGAVVCNVLPPTKRVGCPKGTCRVLLHVGCRVTWGGLLKSASHRLRSD